ncbi:caspase-9 isoform X2 [Elgaria multicarinata webbii]|uniref:caspase-9 isoform X2 n=1 Tax=Elgaria multicarinata webbii TaxID=159646 RepID=UPI002FCD1CC1
MEEAQRQVLQRSRLRLVQELQVDPLWELLLRQGIFTQDMIEEIQRAGTRRDQARQLVTDLQTRGRRAFPVFIWCLQETGQKDLAVLLSEGWTRPRLYPADIKPVEIRPHPGQSDPRVTTSEYLPPPVQVVNEKSQEPTRDSRVSQGSAEEKSRRNSETVYLLKNDPCGYCLIINNVNFSEGADLAHRLGSDVDCERLEKRFRSLGFEVLTRRDLKAHTSHIRFPGGIFGSDGRSVSVEKIVDHFNGTNCPSLRGKPKLFFIQACGGAQKDRGFEVDSETPVDQLHGRAAESDATPFRALAGDSDQPDAVASLPTPSDILVSYSTFPGFVSWRDKLTGSWYVETLDHVLDQYARSEDLLSMLVMVANAVSAKGTFKQMPGCFNFLRKRFFFAVK